MTDANRPDGGRRPAANLPPIDTTRPQSARVWDYWLGGKDNYAVDRAAGDQVRALIPDIAVGARAERGFLVRAVRHLVADAGIRQFLDIGTGLPIMNNTHEVAQATAPQCRVVYVDNDPLVLVHARALLTSTAEGRTDYLDADLRDPETILYAAARTLDFDRPVALMLLGILNHIVDDGEAYAIVDRLLDALPPGSYLALSHSTAEVHGEAMLEAMRRLNESGGTPITARTRQEILRFFDRLELLEPGVVTCSKWRPDPCQVGTPADVYLFGGIGHLP